MLLSKIESLNLHVLTYVLIVLMPLDIKSRTVPHLKSFTSGIKHACYCHGSTFGVPLVAQSTLILHDKMQSDLE